ncbi:MAG: glycosyltransferase family 9 protein, partial [Methylococcales bacterium]|nr:glycosyltransferase family 9 protein [Methylococcales bacterium]
MEKLEKILVVAMPYLGDVLLATPLIHSLRVAYPNAQLDVLAFKNTQVMLDGNPDVNNVLTALHRASFREQCQLIWQIFRRYDAVFTLPTSDRAFFYSLFAASLRINAVPPKPKTGWWKRFCVQHWVEFDDDKTHTVLQHLKLLNLIDVEPRYTLVPPQVKNPTDVAKKFSFMMQNRYAVLHCCPQWTYKQWTSENWLLVARHLLTVNIMPVFSGGNTPDELAYIENLVTQLPDTVINLAGKTSLAELTEIIKNAQFFVGVDTGATHLAAATGVPVIALFGATNPVVWSPFPFDYQNNENPFVQKGSQHVGNIH